MLMAANVLVAEERNGSDAYVKSLTIQLNISDEQASQLWELGRRLYMEMENIQNDANLSRTEKLTATSILIDKRKTEMKRILTHRQFKEFRHRRKVSMEKQKIRHRMRVEIRRS